jgi:predicted ATP-dependent endonuclease of OLD family
MQIHAIHIDHLLSFNMFIWKELDPHLNVIVGPNGAGKTNLFHALRAVRDALSQSEPRPLRDGPTPDIRARMQIQSPSPWISSSRRSGNSAFCVRFWRPCSATSRISSRQSHRQCSAPRTLMA